MLKPKYGNFTESVQDFNRMLDGMNKTQPLEKSYNDDLQEMFRDEQALVQLEQQIEHITKVISDSGDLNDEDATNLAQMHRQAASAYSQAAQKAEHRLASAKRYGSAEMVAKMENVRNRMRLKAEDHSARAKTRVPEKVVSESVQPNRMSSAMRTMRMLAGIEESATAGLPRDPGLLGTTRFNEGYEKMGQHFDECGCDDNHERNEKKDIKKIKKSADHLDGMHKNMK